MSYYAYCYAECCYAKWHNAAVVLNVIIVSVVMLNVVAPYRWGQDMCYKFFIVVNSFYRTGSLTCSYTITILDQLSIYTSRNILYSYFSKVSIGLHSLDTLSDVRIKVLALLFLTKTFCLSKTQAYFGWSMDYFCQ